MSEHPEPRVVAECTSEIEATIIRNMLREEGIPCEVSGGTIGGMRAEAPGLVQVLVPETHAEQARKMVLEHEDHKGGEDAGQE